MFAPRKKIRKSSRGNKILQNAAGAASSTLLEHLESRRMMAIGPVGSQFIVNSTTAGSQHSPAVAMDATGDFVVAWTAYIDSTNGYDVYAQRYQADGTPIGSEFQVNSLTTGIQGIPSVAMAPDGKFVIAWLSNTGDSGGYNIYAKQYNALGLPTSGDIQAHVNLTGSQTDPAVAMADDGSFAVTWTHYNGTDFDVRGSLFNSSGGSVQDDFLINTITTADQQASTVAMDPTGNFVVAWQGYGDQQGDGIFAQRFDSSGTPLGSEFQVNEEGAGNQSNPSIAMDATGDFVVAFESPNAEQIAFRRFDSNGVAQTTIDTVVQQAPNLGLPAVAMEDDGDFVVTWVEAITYDVFAQKYNAAGLMDPASENMQVNTTPGNTVTTAIAADANGDYVIAWHSYEVDGSGFGVAAQLYSELPPASWPFGDEKQINSWSSGDQTRPRITAAGNGDLIVVWESLDEDGDGYGIFGQRYNSLGEPLGTAFQINTYTTGHQAAPQVAADEAGNFIVVWHSEGQDGDGLGIYARRYLSNGTSVGTEFLVNTYTTGHQEVPDVAMNGTGNFVIVWDDDDDDNLGVFGQYYDAGGTPQGSEFQANTTPVGAFDHPAVAIAADNTFVVVWPSEQGGDLDILGQRFITAGVPLGSEFQVNVNTAAQQFNVDVAIDNEGDFVVVWDTFDGDTFQSSISMRQFNAAGAPIGGETILDSGLTSDDIVSSPTIAMDGVGNFAVTWANAAEPATIRARRFRSSGAPQGSEFQVNINDDSNERVNPSIAMSPSGNLAIVWADSDQDGDSSGIFGVRVERPPTSVLSAGAPLQVNTFTTNQQFSSAVAVDADGDFVVVWHSLGQDGNGYGVYARRYNAGGSPIGSEFLVNTVTVGDQRSPTIAMDSFGNFIIAWQSPDGSGTGVFARRYFNDGSVVDGASEFRVNNFVTNGQGAATVAMNDLGDIAFGWRSLNQIVGSTYDVYARRYNFYSNSFLDEADIQVNTFTTGSQTLPSVGIDQNGNFVVAWQSINQAAVDSGFDIYARRFGSDGLPTSSEFLVNTFTTNTQQAVALAMNDTGSFVIAWESRPIVTGNFDIFVRAYDNSTIPIPLADQFQVNDYILNNQRNPAVAINQDGDFVVAWASQFQDGDLYGVYAHRYDVAGGTITPERQINTFTTGSQLEPSVAMDDAGEFVVTWHGGANQDGNLYGVYARRFFAANTEYPNVVDQHFVWQNAPQRLEFYFDRDVSDSIDDGDLILENLSLDPIEEVQDIVAVWDPVSFKVTFTFPSEPNNGTLRDGIYLATIEADEIEDEDGDTLNQDFTFDFFFINGDLNHSGTVDVLDSYAMATHWFQSSNFSYLVGDFNYDGFVDATDLGILGLNWLKSLADLQPPVPPPPAAPLSEPESESEVPSDPPQTQAPAAVDPPQPSGTSNHSDPEPVPAPEPVSQPSGVVTDPSHVVAPTSVEPPTSEPVEPEPVVATPEPEPQPEPAPVVDAELPAVEEETPTDTTVDEPASPAPVVVEAEEQTPVSSEPTPVVENVDPPVAAPPASTPEPEPQPPTSNPPPVVVTEAPVVAPLPAQPPAEPPKPATVEQTSATALKRTATRTSTRLIKLIDSGQADLLS